MKVHWIFRLMKVTLVTGEHNARLSVDGSAVKVTRFLSFSVMTLYRSRGEIG